MRFSEHFEMIKRKRKSKGKMEPMLSSSYIARHWCWPLIHLIFATWSSGYQYPHFIEERTEVCRGNKWSKNYMFLSELYKWQGRSPEIFSGVLRVTELTAMPGPTLTLACTVPVPGTAFWTTACDSRRDACESGTCTNLPDPTRKELHRAKQSKHSNWCHQKGTELQMTPNINNHRLV